MFDSQQGPHAEVRHDHLTVIGGEKDESVRGKRYVHCHDLSLPHSISQRRSYHVGTSQAQGAELEPELCALLESMTEAPVVVKNATIDTLQK